MTTILSRAKLLLSALVVALLGTSAFTSASLAGRPGVHLTRNGFRTPLYGISQTVDANGTVRASCGALTQPQVEAVRFDRTVSRAMAALSPQAVVRQEGGATFDVTYIDAEGAGFNDSANGATRRRALEAALAAWSKVIRASQTIKVNATMKEMDDGDNNPLTTLLATAGPSEFWLHENKAMPSPLMWQIRGGRFANAGDSDITVNVNDKADWDYALNGVATGDKASFVFTLLHELGHGLGMVDSFDNETGKLLNDPTPFVFDVFVNRRSDTRRPVMDRPTHEVKDDLRSGELFFNGDNGNAASGRSARPMPMLKLYAPDPYQSGSSVSHFDQNTYADIRPNFIVMVPTLTNQGGDKIDSLTLAILKDLGYTLTPEAATTRTR